MRKFNIGDLVYHARCQWSPKQELCPICFGKLKVSLTLGNDECVILPCNYCVQGYSEPVGYVSQYDFLVEAEPVIITDIKVEISSIGEKYKYISANCYYETENIFLDKASALHRAKERKEELDKDQQTRIEWLKKDKQKSFSWNAGYHLRQAKRSRQEAEYHDSKAILCKQRAKGAKEA